MKFQQFSVFASLFAAAVVFGCSGGETPVEDIQDSSITSDVQHDVISVDRYEDVNDVRQDVVADTADIADTTATDIADTLDIPDSSDIEEIVECPGNYLCPCDNPSDCFSGLCVPTPNGSVCSRTCADVGDCPDGYACTTITMTGGDPIFGCVDRFPDICRPCITDDDCVPNVGADNRVYKCNKFDDNGSYCGAECVENRECPTGFICETVGEGETAYTQCMPESGECPCTERYSSAGYETECFVENPAGRCAGKRACDTVCDAATALVESCNLQDDNCDGMTDNGVPAEDCPLENTIGICTGSTICINGENNCQGAYAIAETCNNQDEDCNGTTDNGLGETTCGLGECLHTVANCQGGNLVPCEEFEGSVNEICDGLDNDCNGVTDNGFLDTDLDTIRDCVDPDDDDDTILDGDDNCPLDQNEFQENMDDDEFGDICDNDRDGDGYDNDVDNCPGTFNPDQTDDNHNDIGDDCENDWDSDTILNNVDNCPWVANPLQENMDFDLSGNVCDCDVDGDTIFNTGVDRDNQACGTPSPVDNCTTVPNTDQQDRNVNGIGDACESDWDSDGRLNTIDNCPWIANATQDNMDDDDSGDKCDCDIDGDDVYNTGFDRNNVACPTPTPADNCKTVANALQENMDTDAWGDACDCDIDADGDVNANPGCTGIDSDCAPTNPAIFHNATEKCNNVDDNCVNGIDEGCDDDNDDYCDNTMTTVGTPTVCPNGGGDCNDSNILVKPGATELCNLIDDNCVSGTDEGLGTTTCGLGQCTHTINNCASGEIQTCNPMQGSVAEICDGLDNSCEGTTDEGCDDDGDDFCDKTMTTLGTPAVCPNGGGDCNDAIPQIRPSATEKCDNIDNNCDLDIDEGCDDDGDLYCDQNMTYSGTPSICPNGPGDCNDMIYSRNPAATETCNGVDDNCNGATDDGLGTISCGLGICYHTMQACIAGEPPVCNAMLGSVTEICDGADNDCDGGTDEGCDDDSDDYCDSSMGTIGGPAVCPNGGGDCNDADSSIRPAATEKCNNIDEDCDLTADEGCDVDGDDYCNSSLIIVGTPTVCPNGGGDCNDNSAAVKPSASETCNNIDDDCSGTIDDNIAAAIDTFEPNESCIQYLNLSDIPEDAGAQQFTGKIYPSGDRDFYKVKFVESAHACVPFTSQTFRVTINLTPPTGLDCVDLNVILYNDADACVEQTRSNATGCGAKQIVFDYGGTCTFNDDKTFRFAVVGRAAADWECSGYTMTVDVALM